MCDSGNPQAGMEKERVQIVKRIKESRTAAKALLK